MTSLRFPQITDELLSAYIDKAVTEEEKTLVETAIAAEPAIAWRLEALRQTVALLRTMPAVALPHSFVLSEAQLTAVTGQTDRKQRAPSVSAGAALAGFWTSWRAFWAVGSPWLRNAAAASFAVLLLLLAGDYFLGQSQPSAPPDFTSTAPARVAVVATPAQQATTLPPPMAEAEATSVTVAVSPADPAVETTGAQSLDSAEASDDAMAPQAASSPLPATAVIRAPGPDEGVDFVPGGADGGVFSDGREQGPSIESMTSSVEAPASAQGIAGESAARTAPETSALRAMTEPATNATADSGSGEGSLAADTNAASVTQSYTTETMTLSMTTSLSSPVSSSASPSLSMAVTDIVTTTVMTTTVVTTTTVSSTTFSQTGPLTSTSLPSQNDAPLASEGEEGDAGAAAAAGALSRLEIFQISLALLTVLLGLLWWRSRTTYSKPV